MLNQVKDSYDDELCPDYNKTLKKLQNIDENNIFPEYIIKVSRNGYEIVSKKIRKNPNNKKFININISPKIEDLSKDPNVITLKLIDKFGYEVR